MCGWLHLYQTCDGLARSYEKTVFHGEPCVTMATAFEEISKLSRIHVVTAGLLAHVKFQHFLTIFIGVIAISCFTARDALPWQQLLRKTHKWHRHVEGWTIIHHLKSGAVLTIFIWVTTTSCFMARDVFPWKRHMKTPHHWRRAVEGRTINHYLKAAAVLWRGMRCHSNTTLRNIRFDVELC